MLLVFLSHFGLMYLLRAGDERTSNVIMHIALPSAAVFVLLSGTVLGILFEQRRADFAAQRIKLLDRGLFLLVPAGIVIRLAHHWVERSMGPGVHWFFMTDAIGVCLIVVPRVITRIDGWARVLLGVLILTASWWVFVSYRHFGPVADRVVATLVGDPVSKGAVFAILPWMGAYTVATVVGEGIARWRTSGQPVAARLAGLGVACVVPSVLAHAGRHHGELANLILSAGQKYPPGPVYLLASAGVGLFVLGGAAWAEDHDLVRPVFRGLAMLGRASLVVFVTQYFVYYVGFFLARLPMSPLWPLYFAASVLVNFAFAWIWDTRFGNRYLTLGIPRLVHALRPQPITARGVAATERRGRP